VKKQLFVIALAFALLTGSFLVGRQSTRELPKPNETQTSVQQPTFDKHKYPTNTAGSLWWIVNKKNPAGTNYAPPDLVKPAVAIRPGAGSDEQKLRKEAAAALETLFAGAKKDGVNLMLASGYRSYQTQVSVYNNEVKLYGQAIADTQSAKPGYSEHQTGFAADIEDSKRTCEVKDCFGSLPEGKWLAANAYRYGFVVRYPYDKESITGYRPEPWHIRYVGTELSNELRKQNIVTLEEFFNL
jgi:D-alanyl-D-alanine carboxypeptidase